METTISKFQQSTGLFGTALKIENPDIIQKAGIIQFFEMNFELSRSALTFKKSQAAFAGILKAYLVRYSSVSASAYSFSFWSIV